MPACTASIGHWRRPGAGRFGSRALAHLQAHAPAAAPPGVDGRVLFCSFVTSFDNVVVSIYLIGADTVTLPVRILTYVEWQFNPSIAAISTIFIAVTTVMVIVSRKSHPGGGGGAWAEPSRR